MHSTATEPQYKSFESRKPVNDDILCMQDHKIGIIS